MIGLKLLIFSLILLSITTVSANTINHGDPIVIQSFVEGLGYLSAPPCQVTHFCGRSRGFLVSLSDVSDIFHIRRHSGSGPVRHGDWVRIVHQRTGLVLDACSNPVYVGHIRSAHRGMTSSWNIQKVDGTSGVINQGDKVKFRMQEPYFGARYITAMPHRTGPKEGCNGAKNFAGLSWVTNGSDDWKQAHSGTHAGHHTFMLRKGLQHGSQIAMRSIIPNVGFFKAPNCAVRTCGSEEGKFLIMSNSPDKFQIQHASGASGFIQHNDWVSLVHMNTNLYANVCGATVYIGGDSGMTSKWQIQKIDGSAGPIYPGNRFKLRFKDDYADRYMNIEYYDEGIQVDCEGNFDNAWVTWASDGSENNEEIKGMHAFSAEAPIGCDNVLFSGKAYDKCGVCDGDGSTCQKCEDQTHKCNHICENNFENYICKCNTHGYELLDDKATCVDIDECQTDYHGCSQMCHNNEGSYTCSCHEGYELGEDGKYCHNLAEDSDAFYVLNGDNSKEECLDQFQTSSIESTNPEKELVVACCSLNGSIGSQPGCMKAKNHFEAKTICKNRGERLCTRREIRTGIVQGLPECSFDKHLHWTSTPCGKFTYRHVGCFRTRKNHIHLGQPLTGPSRNWKSVAGRYTKEECFLACQGYTYFTAPHDDSEGGCKCGYKYDNYARCGGRGCGEAWSGSFYIIELKSDGGRRIDLHEVTEVFNFDEISRALNEDARELYLTQTMTAEGCPPWGGCEIVDTKMAQWQEPERMPYYEASFTLSGVPLPESNAEILQSEAVLNKVLTTRGQFLTIQFSITNKEKVMLEILNENIEVEFVGMWGPQCSLQNTFTDNSGQMSIESTWASFDMTGQPTTNVDFCVGVMTNILPGSVEEINVRVHKYTRTREIVLDEDSGKYVKPICYDERIYGGFFFGDEVGSKYPGITGTCYKNYGFGVGENRHMCSFHAGSLPQLDDFEDSVTLYKFADIIDENREWVPADEFCSQCDFCGVNDSGAVYKVKVNQSGRRRLSKTDIEQELRKKFELDEINRLTDMFGTKDIRKMETSIRRSLSDIPFDKRRNLMTQEQWCEMAKTYYPNLYAKWCASAEPMEEIYIVSAQLDRLDKSDCEHFKNLAKNVQLDSEDSDADVKLIFYNHFCNDYKKEKEHIWALGEEGETCMELCNGMGMVTTDRIPNTKDDFESIMISYEHKEGDNVGTKLGAPKSIKEYCEQGISTHESPSAPEMKNGYCIWNSMFMNNNFDRDGMRKATTQDRRRFCSCSKIAEN